MCKKPDGDIFRNSNQQIINLNYSSGTKMLLWGTPDGDGSVSNLQPLTSTYCVLCYR